MESLFSTVWRKGPRGWIRFSKLTDDFATVCLVERVWWMRWLFGKEAAWYGSCGHPRKWGTVGPFKTAEECMAAVDKTDGVR